MADDADIKKAELIRHVIFRIGAPLLSVSRPEEPPLLGQPYAWSLDALFDRLEDINNAVSKSLASLTDEALHDLFDDDAYPKSEAAHHFVALWQRKLRAEQNGMDEWLWAPFFADMFLADFDHWSKVPNYGVDEMLWLSVGLSPLKRWIDLLSFAPPFSENDDPILDRLAKRRDLLERTLDPDAKGIKVTGAALKDLIEKSDLEVHSGFRRMLDAHLAMHSPGPNLSQPDRGKDRSVEPRERNTLATLIYAFAKEKYGYDPQKSPDRVPQSIADLVTRAGLKVDPKTIRKYLLIGAGSASRYEDP